MADWNAELYSRFERERTLPSYDLVRAVEGEPKTVLDIGCGIGNSTQVVAEHFPHARVVGADNSPDMLRYSREKIRSWNLSRSMRRTTSEKCRSGTTLCSRMPVCNGCPAMSSASGRCWAC